MEASHAYWLTARHARSIHRARRASPLALGCSSSSTPAATPSPDASTSGADSSVTTPPQDAGADASDGGDAGDAGASGPGAFVGTWSRSGTETLTCLTTHITEIPFSGDLVIALGTTAGTIVATQPDGCVENYTVSGNVATTTAGQSCQATTEAGVASVSTIVTHTLTVSADGSTLTEAGSDNVAITFPDGGTESCTAASTGSFPKSDDAGP